MNRLLAAFRTFISSTRPLWRDYSYWQLVVNFDIAKANKVHGMFARSSINTGYIDPYWARNYSEAGRVKMYRSSYHVIWPGSNIQDQVDNWFRAHPELDNLPGNIPIPRVIDLEVSRLQPHARIAADTWNMSEIVLSRDGVRPIIYSRHLLINDWLRTWSFDQLNQHLYWLAQYLNDRSVEHPGPPTLPSRVLRKNIILHQTADKKPGFPGEAQSSAVDYNRWCIGDETAMHFWIADAWGFQPEPEPPYVPPPLPEVPMQRLELSPLESKIIFHVGKTLTGKSSGIPIELPNLPSNVKGLDVRVLVWGDKGAQVFFGNGSAGGKDHRVGQWVGNTTFEPPFYENNGFCPLDGNKIWRSHDANNGVVLYALVINGYYVDATQSDPVDLAPIFERLEFLEAEVSELEKANRQSVKYDELVYIKKKNLTELQETNNG